MAAILNSETYRFGFIDLENPKKHLLHDFLSCEMTKLCRFQNLAAMLAYDVIFSKTWGLPKVYPHFFVISNGLVYKYEE